MKLNLESHKIEKFGITNQTGFTIKTTARAFQILSSGLYSNKIQAIVRELSCNAYDAHVAAGTPEKPFKVHLPTGIEPFFSVTDFGIGLSHEEVTTLYTTYFDSTKNDSNDYIGALGLGSKSPFSYTDQFVVNSNYNGVKYCYTAFIDDSGAPNISLLSEQPTDEHNGLEVIVGVTNSSDYRRFEEEAKKVYQWFTTRPQTNVELNYDPEEEPLFSGDGWQLFKSKGYGTSNRCKMIMGNVCYPIDCTSFEVDSDDESDDAELRRDVYRILSNEKIIINAPIGTADVAASREALSYDKTTINNITVIIAEIAGQMFEEMQRTINKAKTYHEAVRTTYEICENHSRFIKSKTDPKDKSRNVFTRVDTGEPVKYKKRIVAWSTFGPTLAKCFPGTSDWDGNPEVNSAVRVACYCYAKRGWNRGQKFTIVSARKWLEDHNVNPNHDVRYYICDEKKGYRARIEELYRTHLSNDTKDITKETKIVILPNDMPAAVDKFIKAMGGPKVHKISELPKATVVRSVNTYNGLEVHIWNHQNRSWDDYTMSRGEKDLNGIFIPTYRDQPMLKRDNGVLYESGASELGIIIKMADCGMLKKSDRIFSVKSRLWKERFDGQKGNKHISDVFAERLTNSFMQTYADKWATVGGAGDESYDDDRWSKVMRKVDQQTGGQHSLCAQFVSMGEKINDARKHRRDVQKEIQPVKDLCAIFNTNKFDAFIKTSSSKSNNLTTQIDTVKKQFQKLYPMIAHTQAIHSYYHDLGGQELEDVVNYIKMIDNMVALYQSQTVTKTVKQAAAA